MLITSPGRLLSVLLQHLDDALHGLTAHVVWPTTGRLHCGGEQEFIDQRRRALAPSGGAVQYRRSGPWIFTHGTQNDAHRH